jgi:AraC family transcriptional regulator of adaptative response / DNA-3-methyladenine glycosylase II
VLAPLVAARPGLRVPGAWDGFELAVRAVLGQQITVAAGVRLAGKLVARYGLPLAGTGLETEGLTHVFPRPEQLASADLTALGMPQMRAATLASLAAAVVADPQVLGGGRSLTECVTRLRELPGIGEWTAQYIVMRELREPDAFPAGDVGLLRAMTDRAGRRPSSRELLARAESWRPWRAYAAQHLWASGMWTDQTRPTERVQRQTKYRSTRVGKAQAKPAKGSERDHDHTIPP